QPGAKWKAPFDDIRLRQAVGYAVNADDIIKNVLYGLATRNYGPMPTGEFAYKPEIEQYGYHHDPAKAKAHLDDAGWLAGSDGSRQKAGKKLELLMWCGNYYGSDAKVIQVIQNQLAAVGVSVKIDVLDEGTFLAQVGQGVSDFDLAHWGWPEPYVL